jgi:SIR2-like domain
MAGHLFIVQADLTRLEVDALAVPTDPARRVEPSWLAHAPDSVRSTSPQYVSADQGPVVRWQTWDDGRHAFLVDVGRAQPEEPKWYAGRAASYVDAAIEGLSQPPRARRERALIGLPVLGTRHAGAAARAGGIIDELIKVLAAKVEADDRYDIVLAVSNRGTFAACQQVRRRLEQPRSAQPRDALVRALAGHALQGRLVVFLGAGVSAGAGLPTWARLLHSLAESPSLSDAEREAIATVDNFLDRARLIADAYARAGEDLGVAIAKRMHADRYALGHALLASMPVNEVVTTNYDTLFERAAAAAHRPATILPYEAVSPGQRWLLKMHGSVDPPRDIVLTREDYLEYGRTRGALLGIVQALLITRHMLFVGFSLDDDNFIRIAHDVRSAVRRPAGVSRPKFGTVLTLVEDPARRMLWERDFDVTSMEPRAGDDAAARARGARQIEILLDRVLAESRPQLAHLLDERFTAALDSDELAVRSALQALSETAGDAPAWRPVHAFLDSFR